MNNVDEVSDRVTCDGNNAAAGHGHGRGMERVVVGVVLTMMCNSSLTADEFADCTLVFSIPVTVGQQQQPTLLIAMARAY